MRRKSGRIVYQYIELIARYFDEYYRTNFLNSFSDPQPRTRTSLKRNKRVQKIQSSQTTIANEEERKEENKSSQTQYDTERLQIPQTKNRLILISEMIVMSNRRRSSPKNYWTSSHKSF